LPNYKHDKTNTSILEKLQRAKSQCAEHVFEWSIVDTNTKIVQQAVAFDGLSSMQNHLQITSSGPLDSLETNWHRFPRKSNTPIPGCPAIDVSDVWKDAKPAPRIEHGKNQKQVL
jgi:hypothetical protein